MIARICTRAALAAVLAAAGCSHDQYHALHRDSEPVITGNPAADPALPPRFGRPGRLLLQCDAQADRGSAAWSIYASAQDFDEVFQERLAAEGEQRLVPPHAA